VDNVTHTLAGLAVAHAALFLRGRRQPETSNGPLYLATLTASAFANNAPDLDFLYRSITPGRLGYLLHHRGHTHTLLAILPLGLFCLALVAALLRLRGQRLARSEWGFLLAVALIGGALHVTMDFGNNYGVHPFWPLDDRWYYGDAIFIVEPWLLIALGGIVFGASRSRTARALIGLILVGLCSVAWWQALGPSPLLPVALAALLTFASAAWLGWMGWSKAVWRRRSALFCLGLGLATQLSCRAIARDRVQRALAGVPSFELVSLASTPMPANPLCWSLLAVGVSRGGREYVIQQVSAAVWPAAWPAGACPPLATGTTAPLVAPATALPARAGLSWGLEFRAPLAELRALAREDCVARAFLRFARVPFWLQAGEHARLIGDERFDRSPAIEFAELPLEPGAQCPHFVPPWQAPLPLLDPLPRGVFAMLAPF
jgi:inner membrane protein